MKLITIQNELKAPKGQYNKFGKYKYRNCEDILEALKPLLLKHECSLTVSDDIVLVGDRYYVKATVTLTECETSVTHEVTAFARESLEKKGMDESQITGAASSYARKYALNGLFAIDDTKDADSSDNRSEDKSPAPKKTNSEKIAIKLELDPDSKWFEVPFPSGKAPHKGKTLGDVAAEQDAEALKAVLQFIDEHILSYPLAQERLNSAITEASTTPEETK